jgi:hypothetical protein
MGCPAQLTMQNTVSLVTALGSWHFHCSSTDHGWQGPPLSPAQPHRGWEERNRPETEQM